MRIPDEIKEMFTNNSKEDYSKRTRGMYKELEVKNED